MSEINVFAKKIKAFDDFKKSSKENKEGEQDKLFEEIKEFEKVIKRNGFKLSEKGNIEIKREFDYSYYYPSVNVKFKIISCKNKK